MHFKLDEAWGSGRCGRNFGIFPLNYTQRIVTSSTAAQLPSSIDGKNIICVVTATMRLEAQIEGELAFDVGDQIAVTDIMPDGWANGQLGSQSGTFPLSFTTYAKESKTCCLKDKPLSELLSGDERKCDARTALSHITSDNQLISSANSEKPLEDAYPQHFPLTKAPQSYSGLDKQPMSETRNTLPEANDNYSAKQGHCSISSADSGYSSSNFKGGLQEDLPKVTPSTEKQFVVAKFSHYGRDSDELSFKEGDVIEVLKRKSDMWLYGKLQGATGYLRQNYVTDYVVSRNGHSEFMNAGELLKQYKSAPERSLNQRKEHAKQDFVDVICQHLDIRLAIQDFKATTDFELSLSVGDTVRVLEHVNDKWTKVKNNKGGTGIVPSSCLQEVKSKSRNNAAKQFNTNSIDLQVEQPEEKTEKSISDARGFSEPSAGKLASSPSNESKLLSARHGSVDNSMLHTSSAGETKTGGFRRSVSASEFVHPQVSDGLQLNGGRRHSHHKRKGNLRQRGVSKSLSMREKRQQVKPDIIRRCRPENALQPDSPIPCAAVLDNSVISSGENDSSSLTSRDSFRSYTGSTGSSASFRTSKRTTSPNFNADIVANSKEIKSRRAIRKAPPPPVNAKNMNSNRINALEPETNLSGVSVKSRTPPVRPPQPVLKHKNEFHSHNESKSFSSTEQKLKIEKIRTDIEEVSRTQKNLESMYNSTFDGKTRQEISEEKQFVVAKLKRLQMELHSLIISEAERENSNSISESQSTQVDSFPSTQPVVSSVAGDPPSIQEEVVDVKEKRRIKRQHVIGELIKTEKDYLQDIVITINDIMKPLIERELPMDIKLEVIFGNIEDIRDCSKALLHSLQNIEWDNSQSTDSSDMNVGRVFIEHAAHMKEVYKVYCRNHDDASALLEKYEDDPEFQVPLQEYLSHVKSKVNTFDLGSFLIKPVQRILKYPLLLQELLKLTDIPQNSGEKGEHTDLISAVKVIQEVANDINEDKRRKDLVRKYRKVSQDANLAEKISRLSLHSVRKKSARISLRLGHVTGFNQPETVDKTFNALEQRFKNLEKSIKSFLQNSDGFGNRYRDVLGMEYLLLQHMADLWASDHTSFIDSYCVAMKRVSQLYRQFHNQTQLRVHDPLKALLVQFRSPQALIEKRFDKLLDYESCQKTSDPKEKIQMTKNVYEALNQQLIDELPLLCNTGCRLLDACIVLYLRLQIKFQRSIIEIARPVLNLQEDGSKLEQLEKKPIMETFNAARNQVLVDMRRFTIIPASFSSVTSSAIEGNASSSTKSVVVTSQQTENQRETLMKKYKLDDIYIATNKFLSGDKMFLSCASGDFIAAVKRQDPLGGTTKWFCDDGATQGFLPSTILKSYSSKQQSSNSTLSESPSSSIRSNEHTDILSTPLNRLSSVRLSANSVSFSVNESAESGDRTSLDGIRKSPLLPNPVEATAEKHQYRLDYDFSARSTLELSVKEGAVVDLIEAQDMQGNSEWWLVANAEGRQGYVPANYMSKVQYL